jgi:hypothetical protein
VAIATEFVDITAFDPFEPSDARVLNGKIGAPMYVLSLPQIREVELLDTETEVLTTNGLVKGRRGDVVVTAKDRYPIVHSVFYGTYEVIGRVDNRLVARRLIHVRKARKVLSLSADLKLSGRQDVLAVERDGWVYQSDDDDVGPISAAAARTGHAEVGRIEQVNSVAWSRRLECLTWFLTFLPPVMTAIEALTHGLPKWGRTSLLSFETLLLATGVGAFIWARLHRWELKAVVTDKERARFLARFQSAAELLGDRRSVDFPQMALWRAAQSPELHARAYSGDNAKMLEDLRKQVAQTIPEIKAKIAPARRIETISTVGGIVAVACVLASNLCLILRDWSPIELVAVCLPSLIGALHALGQQKRVADQIPLLTELARQLEFIRTQLLRHAGWSETETADSRASREATLRTLCKVIGQYSQAELRLAIRSQLSIPDGG